MLGRPPPRLFPGLSLSLIASMLFLHMTGLSLGFSDGEGWFTALRSVFSHRDGSHLAANLSVASLAFPLLEWIAGRTVLLMLTVLVSLDVWLLTAPGLSLRGASGLVYAATGALLLAVPVFHREAWCGSGPLRVGDRLLGLAAAFALLVVPIPGVSDILSLSTRDGVYRVGHLRGLVTGLLLSSLLLLGRVLARIAGHPRPGS